jgi:hypothetical protein
MTKKDLQAMYPPEIENLYKETLENDGDNKSESKIKEHESTVQLSNDKVFARRVEERNEKAKETIEELESSNEIKEDNKKSSFNFWVIGGVIFLGSAFLLSRKLSDTGHTQIKKQDTEVPKMDTNKDFLS